MPGAAARCRIRLFRQLRYHGPGETFCAPWHHGLPVAAYALAASGREAADAAERLGYPVAVKIASPNLLHKTEKGAVALGLKDAKAVRQAIGRMEGKRYLVQKMAPARLRGDRGWKAGQGIRTGHPSSVSAASSWSCSGTRRSGSPPSAEDRPRHGRPGEGRGDPAGLRGKPRQTRRSSPTYSSLSRACSPEMPPSGTSI